MAGDKEAIRKACRVLESEIEKNKAELDMEQETIAAEDLGQNFHRFHIGKKPTAIAYESLKHQLAILQSSVKTMETHFSVCPNNQEVLNNVARAWQSQSAVELQEILVEEKLKQTKLKEEIIKKEKIIKENKQLVEVLQQEKHNLQNKHTDLENQKIKDLEEKYDRVNKLYKEMRVHLKETVETYFPEPQIPGFIGMYGLLNELTQRIQNRERDTYVNVTNTMWPYYLEILERHGIIERHPSELQKIRMVDFSDGRLGS